MSLNKRSKEVLINGLKNFDVLVRNVVPGLIIVLFTLGTNHSLIFAKFNLGNINLFTEKEQYQKNKLFFFKIIFIFSSSTRDTL